MGFFILLILILLGFLGLLGWNRWQDQKYLKSSAKETMDKDFRKEIEMETEDTLRRRRKFEQSMKRHGF